MAIQWGQIGRSGSQYERDSWVEDPQGYTNPIEDMAFLRNVELYSAPGKYPPRWIPVYVWQAIESYRWAERWHGWGLPAKPDSWTVSVFNLIATIDAEMQAARQDRHKFESGH